MSAEAEKAFKRGWEEAFKYLKERKCQRQYFGEEDSFGEGYNLYYQDFGAIGPKTLIKNFPISSLAGEEAIRLVRNDRKNGRDAIADV